MDLYPVHFFAQKTITPTYNLSKHKMKDIPIIMCVNHNEYTKCAQKYGMIDVVVHLIYQDCIGYEHKSKQIGSANILIF
jgi:hypothetical protein